VTITAITAAVVTGASNNNKMASDSFGAEKVSIATITTTTILFFKPLDACENIIILSSVFNCIYPGDLDKSNTCI
jgi:hypothetical protein